MRLAREGGDRRDRRQGRDARARRRERAAGDRRRRCGRDAPAPGRRAGPSSASTSCERSTTRSSPASCAPRRGWRVGDPADERTQLGPLSSRRQARCASASSSTRPSRRGARLHCGGPLDGSPSPAVERRRLLRAGRAERRARATLGWRASPSTGRCWRSTRSTPRRRRSRGPTTATTGSAASVWTADRYRGTRIARELHAGMVWLNDHLPGPTVSRGPWGAAAGSGLGRTLGEAGLRACAQEKLITWDPPGMRGLWWGPYDATSFRAARSLSRGCAPSARPIASAPGARVRCRWRGWSRARSVAACRDREAALGARSSNPLRSCSWDLPRRPGLTCPSCPPRPTPARSASASSARGSATRAACRGCSTPPSTSPA